MADLKSFFGINKFQLIMQPNWFWNTVPVLEYFNNKINVTTQHLRTAFKLWTTVRNPHISSPTIKDLFELLLISFSLWLPFSSPTGFALLHKVVWRSQLLLTLRFAACIWKMAQVANLSKVKTVGATQSHPNSPTPTQQCQCEIYHIL